MTTTGPDPAPHLPSASEVPVPLPAAAAPMPMQPYAGPRALWVPAPVPVPTVLGRVLLTMLPFAAVPWVAVRQDVNVAFLISVVGLVAYAVVAASLFRALEVPSPWVTGGVATVLAAGAQVVYALVVAVGDLGQPVLENFVGLEIATVTGATVGVLLIHAGRGVPVSVPFTIAGAVAGACVFAVVSANLIDSSQDDEELRNTLESTGLPAYLPEFAGYSPSSVSSGLGSTNLDGDPTYSISYTTDDGDSAYRAPALYLQVQQEAGGTVCEELTPIEEDCSESDGVATDSSSYNPQVAVAVDGALLVLSPGFGGDKLSVSDLQDLAPGLRQAKEKASFEDLVDIG